jgi:anti-sigma B factor antagonist
MANAMSHCSRWPRRGQRRRFSYNPHAAPMAITITERRVGDVTILEVAGRIVFYDGAAILRAHINELVDQARLKFILDMRGVTYIDSFGVGVIAAKYVSIRRKGGEIKLLALSPRSHQVMTISGLLKIFESFESEDDAVRSFSGRVQPKP